MDRAWVSAVVLALVLPCTSVSQPLQVTFRWSPEGNAVGAFLPGEFNGWGPNIGGFIAPGAVSAMTYDADMDQWLYSAPLMVGETFQYKVHLHYSADGSEYAWISDPLNDRVNPADNNNSVVTITDPMVFQLAPRTGMNGQIREVLAGVFSSAPISSITLEINGEAMDGMPFLSSSGVFRYAFPEAAACSAHLRLTAVTTSGRSVVAEVGQRPPQVVDRPRPAGVVDGVTFDNAAPTSATLSLYAPGKCFVHAIGDFNDWQPGEDYLMYRDAVSPDSVHWWLTVEGLTGETAYQYLIDGQLRIADPFSRKLLDPVHDQHITAATYPDLMPYPHGMTQGMVSVIMPPREPFIWTPFEPVTQGELVIYELLIRDFLGKHDFSTLSDTLGYLERLGINAIELMPVAEFGGNLNWGYQPQFPLAVDKYYGPAEDLKRFVDEAHKRGIAVILDVVYNHVDLPSPLITLYGATDENPWINVPARHPYNVFFDINHEDSFIREWLHRANAYWLTEFNVDGFRFDLSKGFTQVDTRDDAGRWGAYDVSRVAILKDMAARIWFVNPEAYVILEHFAADREERELAGFGMDRGLPGMMVWNNVHQPYGEAVMGYHIGGKSDLSRSYFGAGGRGWSHPHTISYMESHDEQWLMYQIRRYGACERASFGGSFCDPGRDDNFGTYNTRHLGTALERMKLAGVFFFLLPGPRMMWQFGELGYGYGDRGEQCLRPSRCPPTAPERTGSKPIRWDYRNDPLRARLYDFYGAILGLRHDQAVFRDPTTDVTLQVKSSVKSFVLRRGGTEVRVVGNFDIEAQPNPIALAEGNGYWYEYVSGDSLRSSGALPELAPGEYRIYSNVRMGAAPDGVVSVGYSAEVEIASIPTAVEVYPNPFLNEVRFEATVPVGMSVKLEIYDMVGRRVALLVDRYVQAGRHRWLFAPDGYPAGAYIYRMRAADRVTGGTLTLMQ